MKKYLYLFVAAAAVLLWQAAVNTAHAAPITALYIEGTDYKRVSDTLLSVATNSRV